MTLIEAAKQAREAFEWNFNTDLDNIPACERWAKMLKENITALNQAIAEAEQQEPVAWVYPEGLEALKNGKPWTAYGTKQEANNIALYLHPTPECEPYAWVTFTPYGDEDDVWYENPEGKLLEGWTYKPLYDATPLQSTWVDLTEAEIDEICLGDEAKVRTALQLLKEKNT